MLTSFFFFFIITFVCLFDSFKQKNVCFVFIIVLYFVFPVVFELNCVGWKRRREGVGGELGNFTSFSIIFLRLENFVYRLNFFMSDNRFFGCQLSVPSLFLLSSCSAHGKVIFEEQIAFVQVCDQLIVSLAIERRTLPRDLRFTTDSARLTAVFFFFIFFDCPCALLIFLIEFVFAFPTSELAYFWIVFVIFNRHSPAALFKGHSIHNMLFKVLDSKYCVICMIVSFCPPPTTIFFSKDRKWFSC